MATVWTQQVAGRLRQREVALLLPACLPPFTTSQRAHGCVDSTQHIPRPCSPLRRPSYACSASPRASLALSPPRLTPPTLDSALPRPARPRPSTRTSSSRKDVRPHSVPHQSDAHL